MDKFDDCLHREDANGLQESDLVPHPLRIMKRENQKTRSASSVFIPTANCEQKASFSSQQPSMRKSHTHTDLSNHKTSLQSSAIAKSLNIRKQRRNEFGHARPDKDSNAESLSGITLSYPPAPPRLQEDHDLASIKQSVNAICNRKMPRICTDRARDRAVTCPSPSNLVSLGSLLGKPSTLSEQIPLDHRGQQRAVTSTATLHSLADLKKLEVSLGQEIGRRRSIKQRFVSRVMNGLNHKPKANFDAVQPSHCPHAQQSTLTGILDTSIEPRSSSARADMISSTTTESYLGSDFDTVIAAFPTPPSSSSTSPTTSASYKTSRLDQAAALQKPEDVSVLGVGLRLTSELSKLSSGSGQSVFVAVEVKGALSAPSTSCEALTNIQGLDIAVVIDNSLYTSPATLMASCETARFIASLLSSTMDRMAILSTMPVDVDAPNPRVISPLSKTTAYNAKSKLDTIVSSLDKPNPEALSTTVKLAKEILTQSSFDERRQPSLGHIFVLSPALNGLSSNVLRDEVIQTHLISPGSIPWKITERVECNGWKLRPYYTDQLQFLTYNKKDTDADSLFNRLRSLISHARRGVCFGAVNDLVMDLHAGENCTIEGIMKGKVIPFLQPGEVDTTLVKVGVGTPPAKGYSLSNSQESQQQSPSTLDLTDEIDSLLGTSATTILTATVRYKHSLLPAGTSCTVIAETRLKRDDPISSRSRLRHSSLKVQHRKVTSSQKAVQKKLVYSLATSCEPRYALFAIAQEFGDAGCRSVCPEYVKLVSEELRYQARIVDRFDLVFTESGFVSSEDSRSALGYLGHGLFDVSNYMLQGWGANFSANGFGSALVDRRRRSEDSAKRVSVDALVSRRRISGGGKCGWAKMEDDKENWSRDEMVENWECAGRDMVRDLSGIGRVGDVSAAWV